jgi:hypothetical protein
MRSLSWKDYRRAGWMDPRRIRFHDICETKPRSPLVPAVRGVILTEQSQNVELLDEEARAWRRDLQAARSTLKAVAHQWR